MKRSEVNVGKTNHNGKQGRFYAERLVLAEGPNSSSTPAKRIMTASSTTP